MKPIHLGFCGVNSFSEPAEIDFRALLDYGLFGIFGDTGSGKSTILDCIGFALYGDVARSRTGSIADVINYRTDRAYVHFEFETVYGGRRRVFRAEREIKRKNAVQSAKLYERDGEKLIAISEGVRDVNARLKEIVGLEQRDFEKCIALPQGEFAQFVRSARSDRLRLVSRLFDLEEYGERLVKKVNARWGASKGERDVLAAKLEPYAEITEDGNRTLSAAIVETEARQTRLKAELAGAREEERRVCALCEKRAESEKVRARFSELGRQEQEMRALESGLSRLERAERVVSAEEERKKAEKTLSEAESALERAQARTETARKEAEEAARAHETEALEGEIARLTERRALAEGLARTKKLIADKEEKLAAARRGYREEATRFVGFDYASERAALTEFLQSLGEGDFVAFAERHVKAELFREEYGAFADELTALAEEFPVAEARINPLIGKYRSLSEGERTGFSRLRAEYERAEREKKETREKLLALEKRNGAYEAHKATLQSLQTEGVRLKEELEELKKTLPTEDDLSPEEAGRALEEKRREKKARAERLQRAEREFSAAQAALAAAQTALTGAESAKNAAVARAETALKAGDFRTADEARALTERYGDAERASARLNEWKNAYAAVSARLEELQREDLTDGTAERLALARETLSARERETEEASKELALLRDRLRRNEEALVRKIGLERDYCAAKERTELFERLKKLLEGNKFMEYAAEEYLQNVALTASGRLLTLTDGRYFLRYDDGFAVGDNFNGGKTRGVHTLSGGETFLVSLSLALALSAEICARSLRSGEFFFLDEGFGTLDERLVDTVMDSLEKLRSENFSIGIISHVEELKHRIDRKLTVVKANEKHGSQIHAE